ncbi:unnamed protein product [Polarella glacialis]|uniref:Myosin motor domain-containing protein n=1 Tax=Polarella glacialis TaxID=89957 RepID=A0A813F7Y8_POLGL|nr:unnamed protein product [Polarella glacialis]
MDSESEAAVSAAAWSGFDPGTPIWVPCPESVWREAIVDSCFEDAGGPCVVVHTMGHNGSRNRLTLPAYRKSKSPSGRSLNCVQRVLGTQDSVSPGELSDLSLLALLREPEVLYALQARFEEGLIYTFTGPMLLAVNPFRSLPSLYDDATLQLFANLAPGAPAPSPHIYGVARNAYNGVRSAAASQTVLISGESGAGKTENTKFVMRFLALAGAGHALDAPDGEAIPSIVRRVLQSIPLLEALGNAKTLRNDNSSRFGKYVELQFDAVASQGPTAPLPCLQGAQTLTYLLEKVRVTSLRAGERSFHIFYQVLAAAARAQEEAGEGATGTELPRDLLLPGGGVFRGAGRLGIRDFPLLTRSACWELIGQDDLAAFDMTLSALLAFDVSHQDISDMFAVTIALLHLSNVAFTAPVNNSEGAQPSLDERSERGWMKTAGGPLAEASVLLGVEAAELEAAFCKRAMEVSDGSKAAKSKISQIRSVQQASDSRDAFARHLYGTLFSFAVGRINAVLSADGDDKSGRRLSNALPFIGVLDIFGFESFEHNTFEQLCINFANELLQQSFNEIIFEHEAALYTSEGIDWDPQDFPNNTAIIELLSGNSTALLSGLFPMLDEECNILGGSPESWCRKLQVKFGPSTIFQSVKQRKNHFVIQHFAGPVEYSAEVFLVKNKDRLSADVLQCVGRSSCSFVRQRFQEQSREFGTQVAQDSGRVLRAKAYSVSSEFRRYQGVLQAMQVSRAGYQVRLRHREVLLTYRALVPKACRQVINSLFRSGKDHDAVQHLVRSLVESLPSRLANCIRVGRTLVFLKQEATEELNAAMRRVRHEASSRIQARQRSLVCARRYRAILQAAVRLQSGERARVARRHTEHLRRDRAAERLQRVVRGRSARKAHSRRLQALATLQRWMSAKSRCRRRDHSFQQEALLQQRARHSTAARIQAVWRNVLACRRVLKLRDARASRAIAAQKLVHRRLLISKHAFCELIAAASWLRWVSGASECRLKNLEQSCSEFRLHVLEITAVRLQTLRRRALCIRSFSIARNAAVQMQAGLRTISARRQLLEARCRARSVELLQRWWRRTLPHRQASVGDRAARLHRERTARWIAEGWRSQASLKTPRGSESGDQNADMTAESWDIWELGASLETPHSSFYSSQSSQSYPRGLSCFFGEGQAGPAMASNGHSLAARLAARKRRWDWPPWRRSYRKLLAGADTGLPAATARQIRSDLARTLRMLPSPCASWGWPLTFQPADSVVHIILAYEWRSQGRARDTLHSAFSYVRGVDFIAAMCLGFMRGQEKEAFWLFTFLVEDVLGPDYFSLGYCRDQIPSLELAKAEAPQLFAALASVGSEGVFAEFSFSLSERLFLSGFVGFLGDASLLGLWEELLERRCARYPRLPLLAWQAGLLRRADTELAQVVAAASQTQSSPSLPLLPLLLRQVMRAGHKLPCGARPVTAIPPSHARELEGLAGTNSASPGSSVQQSG